MDGRFVTHRSVTDGNIKKNLSEVSAGAIHFCQRDCERSEPQYIYIYISEVGSLGHMTGLRSASNLSRVPRPKVRSSSQQVLLR